MLTLLFGGLRDGVSGCSFDYGVDDITTASCLVYRRQLGLSAV
jgi:hypothetical protein